MLEYKRYWLRYDKENYEDKIMIKLSKRLQQIANFVPLGTKVADIGTDHALLPCYLVLERICPQAIASDVNEGPLDAAKRQIRALLLTDRISLRLGDGLQILETGEVQTVIIAGMGGGTIRDILDTSPQIVKKLQRIILQPNVSAELIRLWAFENKWKIVDEELVFEGNLYYEIIVLEPGKMILEDEIYFFLGPKLVEKYHVHLVPYLKKQERAEQEILRQLEKSNKEEAKKKAQAIKNKWDKVKQVIACRLNVEM